MHFLHRKTSIAVAALIAVVMFWFAPWWMQHRVLAPLDMLNQFIAPWRTSGETITVHNHFASDAITQYLPYRMFAEKSYREDGFVGWNNLVYGGQAQYANTMGLYFDWTMQLHRWLPFWSAWHLGLIGQFLIAGTGMFVFLQTRRLSLGTSVAAAVAYMGNFQFVAWIHHRWALGSFCWMPWLLVAWQLQKQKGNRFGLWIPPVLALACLGGTLQHVAFVFIALLCLWVSDLWEKFRARNLEHNESYTRITLKYFCWGLLGSGLAAMMFVPCIQAYLTSVKLGQTRGGFGYILGWSQPLLNFAAYPFFIFPSVFGNPQSLDLWKLFKSDLFYLPYFGFIPTLFGLVSLFRWKTVPPAARLLVFAGLFLPLTPLVGPFYQRVFLLFILGGVWAFAEIWEGDRVFASRFFKPLVCVFVAASLCWLGASAVIEIRKRPISLDVQAKLAERSDQGQFSQFSGWMDGRARHLVDSLPIWSAAQLPFFVCAVAGFALWGWQIRRQQSTGSWLAIVIFAELTLMASHWVTFSRLEEFPAYARTDTVKHLQQTVGGGRLVLAEGELASVACPPNTLMPLNLAVIEGYESIFPPNILSHFDSIVSPKALTAAGVTHCATLPASLTGQALGWPEVWRDSTLAVYVNPAAPERYQLMGGEKVSVLNETQNRRLFKVPAGTGSLRIAENYGEGWQYSLDDGQWLSAQPADDGSMKLPLGDRDTSQLVRMRYQPMARTLGLAISGLSLLILVVCAANAVLAHSAGLSSEKNNKIGTAQNLPHSGFAILSASAAIPRESWGNGLTAGWIFFCAWCVLIGEVLSAFSLLSRLACGVYSAAGIGIALLFFRRLTGTSWPFPKIRLRRFLKPFPMLFLFCALAALVGGAIHPPSNYDALSYRVPRVLHWLAEMRWHWIGGFSGRMDSSSVGFEWIMLPSISIFRTLRMVYLINVVSYILLPGLIFSAFRALGIRGAVAATWMWILPCASCFALQAGSIGNDMWAANFLLAAIVFTKKALDDGKNLHVWLAFLAVGLLTGAKLSNLPLLLPIAILFLVFFYRWPQSILSTLPAVFVAFLVSLGPLTIANIKYTRHWTGDPTSVMKLEHPIAGISGNLLKLGTESLVPAVFPFTSKWNHFAEQAIHKFPLENIKRNFPKLSLNVKELASEEASGLGLGVTATLLFYFLASITSPRSMKQLVPARLALIVAASFWVALFYFMAKIGSSSGPRLLTPYYPGLCILPLLLLGQRRVPHLKWWRVCGLILLLPIVPALMLNPARPLLPVRSLVALLKDRGAAEGLVRRLETVYEVYGMRPDAHAAARDLLPATAKVIGFGGTADDSEVSFWAPLGYREVKDFTPLANGEIPNPAGLDAIVTSDWGCNDRFKMTPAELAESLNWQILGSVSVPSYAKTEPRMWSILVPGSN